MFTIEALTAATNALMSCFTDLELFSSRMYPGERFANIYYPGSQPCDIERQDGSSYSSWREFAEDVVAKHAESNRLVQIVLTINGRKTTFTLSHIHDDKISWRLQERVAFNPTLAQAASVEKASKANTFLSDASAIPSTGNAVVTTKRKLMW